MNKIELKYALVKSKYSKKVRFIWSGILSILYIGLFILLIKAFPSKYENSIISFLIILISLTILFDFITKKILLRYEFVGQIVFYEDYYEVNSEGKKEIINYDDVAKIEYCNFLQSDIVTPFVHFKTILVNIRTKSDENRLFEISRELHLSKKDKNRFHGPPPMIEKTLRAIRPKYGFVENRKLTRN